MDGRLTDILVCSVLGLAYGAGENVLSNLQPEKLRAIAFVPIGSRRFKVHPSRLVGEDPAERPASYRTSATAPLVPIVPRAFPRLITADKARLVPLAGGTSAIVYASNPAHSDGSRICVDAVVGPEPDDLHLRARTTPFACAIGVLAPVLLALRLGAPGFFFGLVVTAGCVVILSHAKQAARWAMDQAETRMRRMKRPRRERRPSS